MKRIYTDELKRLAEIEKQINPTRSVKIDLPDGSTKTVSAEEYWKHRDEWNVSNDQDHALLFSLMLMEDAVYRDGMKNGNVGEALSAKKSRDIILRMIFGDAKANKIIVGEKIR